MTTPALISRIASVLVCALVMGLAFSRVIAAIEGGVGALETHRAALLMAVALTATAALLLEPIRIVAEVFFRADR